MKRNVLIFTILLVFIGSFLKLYYIHYTDTWERQHDVISFGADEGHAYYIEYLLENKKLPDFDPRLKWGLFQPPLHHMISAVVLSTSEMLGFNEKRSQENIQIFTCAYMILLTVLTVLIYYKNSREWKQGALVTALIVSFHPVFILLSGSINNDALALILSLVSLFTAAVWYDKPTYLNTVLLALLIGLSMMAKLTGGLVAVPVFILMVMRCFDLDGARVSESTGRGAFFIKNYLFKMCVFAAVVFPTGLFFSIRNKIKWGVPLNYIPHVGENFSDDMTVFKRIFDVRTGSVFPYLKANGREYDEFNVFLLMMKSSLFGEYDYSGYGRLINLASKVCFLTAAVLALVCLYATFKVVFGKEKYMDIKWKVLLFGGFATYLAAYLLFMLTHANFSAGDFRYAAVCIVFEGVFLGIYTDSVSDKRMRGMIFALAGVFALSTAVTYIMLGVRG